MTDADLAIESEFSRWSAEREQDRAAALAHMIAGFDREKRLKPLKSYLRKPETRISREEAARRRREFEDIKGRLA